MRFLSVCSGIEAASCAWHSLGWKAAAFSEIEAFPSAVLAHHYPDVPNVGDMTKFKEWNLDGAIDLLVGGTPCQSFSVAGLRKGLEDPRGNLMLTYLAIADRFRPRWLVWENVPGVLSSNGGRDFGTLLGGLAQLGYGFAYRVLDAQHFGVPQRRRRVFVVGHLGDWRRAAAVLFERHSLQGNPSPRRQTGKGITASPGGIAGNVSSKWSKGSGGPAGDEHYNLIAANAAPPLTSNPYGDHESREALLVAHSLRGEGFDASEDGTWRGTPLIPILGPTLQARTKGGGGLGTDAECDGGLIPVAVAFAQNSRDEVRLFGGDGQTVGALAAEPGMKQTTYVAFSCKDHGGDALDGIAPTLRAMGHRGSHANAGGQIVVAFHGAQDPDVSGDVTHPLGRNQGRETCVAYTTKLHNTGSNNTGKIFEERTACLDANSPPPALLTAMRVRRLTPRECERLMGFPDDYTLISVRGKPAADGPRYKALGNSMAVPVMAWIGRRIADVDVIREARVA